MAAFNKKGDCCCPGTTPNPNPCATYCVKVNGPDLSGLTATLLGTMGGQAWSKDVALDGSGSGCYTLPDGGPYPTITGARVVSPYCSYTTPNPSTAFTKVGTTCTAQFWYCSRRARVTYTANPPLAITFDNFNGSITSDTGSVRTYTACYLSNTNPGASYFNPITVTAYSNTHSGASGNEAWPGTCATGTIPCGGVTDFDVTQQDFSAGYFRQDGCDTGCDKGKGPCGRGLIPKHLQIKFETVRSGIPLLFASDEGQWIDIYGTATSSSGGNVTGITWDSGNRGPQGNRMSVDGVNYDTAPPGSPVMPFEGTRVFFRYSSGGNATLDYGRLPRFGTNVVGPECQGQNPVNCTYKRSTDGRNCSPCFTYGTATSNVCAGQLDGTYTVGDGFGPLYRYSLRELECGSGKSASTPGGDQPAEMALAQGDGGAVFAADASQQPMMRSALAPDPGLATAAPTDLYVLADLCPMGSGPCGCGAEPRLCGHPDRALEVWRSDCLRCVANDPARALPEEA